MDLTNRTLRRIAGAVIAALLALAPAGVAYAQVPTKRLSGPTRYDTMQRIVTEGFKTCRWAVVATGDNFPDALCASALAGVSGCPVILTSGTTLSPQAAAELDALGVTNVYLMGGPAAITPAVEAEIASRGISCERIAGASRQETSVKTMQTVREAGSASDTIVVATGMGFADALSVGPYSFASESPIVLTAANGLLPEATVSAIHKDARIKHILIIGGTSVVGEGVRTQLGGTYTYERLGASDRYGTSSAVATWSASHGLNWNRVAVATGQNFPDALSGASMCGMFEIPLVLVSSSSNEARTLVAAHAANIELIYVLGGEAAVSNAVANSVAGGPAAAQPAQPAQPAAPQPGTQSGIAGMTSGWFSAWRGRSDAGEDVYYAESTDGKRAVLVVHDPTKKAYLAYAGAASNPSQSIVSITDDSTGQTFSYEMLKVDDKMNMSVSLGSENAELTHVPMAEVAAAIAAVEAGSQRVV